MAQPAQPGATGSPVRSARSGQSVLQLGFARKGAAHRSRGRNRAPPSSVAFGFGGAAGLRVGAAAVSAAAGLGDGAGAGVVPDEHPTGHSA